MKHNITQLDGSSSLAHGIGLKLICCPKTQAILPLWPTYYMPDNDTCTFSLTALKHYNMYPSVVTNHLDSLTITTKDNTSVKFPCIPTKIKNKLLDYHELHVIIPKTTIQLPFRNHQ